jgi:hypothetical protein
MQNNIENIARQINDYKVRAKLLSAPIVKKLALKHPDAEFYAHPGVVRGTINLYQSRYENNPVDISGLDGVSATSNSYRLKRVLLDKQYKINGEMTRVVLEIDAEQQYSEEEVELLRSIGKLQQQTNTYDALVCGF